ncbi:MAG: carboxypeptidase-like regulatory domain-containing protein [Candidatus Sulfotelmatobacter sp.]
MLTLVWSVRPSGQMVGSCPPTAARSPQKITELRGVVVDENLAVVPKVKVRLQARDGRDLRDIEVIETDPTGRFSFEAHDPGQYRLVFVGPKGFCPATIPVRYSKTGLKGIRLTLPIGASDTCPQYCESRLKIEEMTGREGRE